MTELLNTLYVQTQGASLYLDHDAVRIVLPDDRGSTRLPLRRLDEIVVYGHVTVSSELLSRCAEDGRAIVWMNPSGRFLARVEGRVRGNVLLRHEQHLRHADHAKRLAVARCCVAGKIQNSRQLLIRSARDAVGSRRDALRDNYADKLARLLPEVADCSDLSTLLGFEGQASRLYFEALGLIINDDTDVGKLTRRNRRPPTDPINALLSFLYGLLRSAAHGAAEQVGLDPHLGYLHGLRPGRPALALDLMEEFRPLLADRLAITLINRRQLRGSHFEELPGGAVRLTEEGRMLVLTAWQQSKERTWQHKLLARKVPAGLLPVVQARILARHIRGELPSYVPWTAS